MKFVYKPEGAEARTWEFQPHKLLNVEAEEIERRSGMTYGEWSNAVQRGSITALHALLYVLLRRSNPGIKYDEVTFTLDELDFVVDDDDARDIVAALSKKKASGEQLSDSEQRMLDRLLDQGVEAPEAPFE